MSLSQVDTMSQYHASDAVYVLGVRVDRLSQRQALESIEDMIAQWRASDYKQPCRQVVTVNPEFVMVAQHNKDFLTAINAAVLVVADGMGVVWATRYIGRGAPERVTGTDLLPDLARCCAAAGYRLYLLGAAAGVAEAAGARLQELAPGLEIAGTYAGSPAREEEDEIIERVRAANADVLCVAYGAPGQELWIWRNLARLPVAVAMGVGGAYDFLAGRQHRAPAFMRNMGLEWLYRLYREPRRWRRMLALPRFAVRVVLRGRKKYDA
jgi:N-acetylglucosaminyldiphosphoundecaprenol N-acetyl-beta-D-mannosaminyltransferase